MIPPGFNIVPESGGELFTSSRSTAAGLNKPRWAKITGSAGVNPVRYSWEEQTFQALAPGQLMSIGFAKADAGIVGTVSLNPVIEPNGLPLQDGDYVLVQKEYFDPTYDWIFVVIGGTSANVRDVELVRNDEAAASGACGRYDSTLVDYSPIGCLYSDIEKVWLVDASVESSPGSVLDPSEYLILAGQIFGP